jgi:hypothetical protein
MRKPKDMKIREYVDRFLEINRYLAFFPTNTGECATVLPDDEIMDILMYGSPNTWQKHIVELNFDAQAHTPNEFIEMCERISYGESFNEGTTSKPKVAFQEHNNKGKNNKKKPPTANPNGSKYCPLHKTNGHDAKECKVLLTQVKKISASYESKTYFLSNKRQKKNYNKSKSEQMFSFMVKAFKAANNKEKSSTSNDKKRKANEKYAFDDDIFDEFNLDDNVSSKDDENTDSDSVSSNSLFFPDDSTSSCELGESLVVDGTQVVDGFSTKNLKAWYFNQGGGRQQGRSNLFNTWMVVLRYGWIGRKNFRRKSDDVHALSLQFGLSLLCDFPL